MSFTGIEFVEKVVHDRQHLARLHADEENLIVARHLGGVERTDVNLPGHGVLRPNVFRMVRAGGALAQRTRIGKRHLAARLIFFGDNDLQILGFFTGQLAQKMQHRPGHHYDDDQHETCKVGQRGPQQIAAQALERYQEETRQPAERGGVEHKLPRVKHQE